MIDDAEEPPGFGQTENGDVVVRPDGEQGSPTPGLGSLGMAVFLASLSMLFVASLMGFVIIRFKAETWPPAGAPALPRLLWLSTLLALACSVTMQRGLRAIQAGNAEWLNRYLVLTNLLAVTFLMVQGWAWYGFFDNATFREHLYGFTFYMLTGLHAAHVVGGMISLGIVTWHARRGKYNWAYYPGVRHATLYWHFLDAVWLVLFGVLLIAS